MHRAMMPFVQCDGTKIRLFVLITMTRQVFFVFSTIIADKLAIRDVWKDKISWGSCV